MILTWARSGMARSGATRAGYPALLGAHVRLYALSNVARSGATRSNYHSSKSFIAINGIQYAFAGHVPEGPGILAESLTIHTAVNAAPATLSMTAYGFVPVEGSDLVITLGSINNARREFAGSILSVRTRYVGDKPVAANMLYDVSGIDWMWGLGRRKVSGDYRNTTVAAIAASLMTFAPAGYALRVEPDIGAEVIDEISFTETTLPGAFSQLVKRVGGDYNCDYLKVIKLFFVDASVTPPTIVNAVHPSMNSITYARDLSQVITRCLGEFGGSEALDAIGPGETLIPVATAAWYLSTGGVVLVGEQRVTYGGIAPGSGGSLVGPGAAPTGAPNAALLPGAGVNVGSHDYAVTFKTASGESIPGPRLTVPVGVFLSPTTAPTPGAAGPGATGPDPGPHDYAVSFVISTGETVPGPRVVATTDLTPPPTAGPTPDSVSGGPGPDLGSHDYAITFGTATGETLPGPIGPQITVGYVPPPTSGPTPDSATMGAGPDDGIHDYAVTFRGATGETTPGPVGPQITTGAHPSPGGMNVDPMLPSPTATALAANQYDYAMTFVIGSGETTPGPLSMVDTRQTQAIAPPASIVVNQQDDGYQYAPYAAQIGDRMRYAVSWTPNVDQGNWANESLLSAPSAEIVVLKAATAPAGSTSVMYRTVSVNPGTPDPRVMYQRLWESRNGGPWQLSGNSAGNGNFTLQVNAAPNPANPPPPTSAKLQGPCGTLPLSWASGGTPEIGFRLYRRVRNTGVLQLVRQFPNSVGRFGITAPPSGTQIFISGDGQGPLGVGCYSYRITFVTAEGETEPSASSNVISISNPAVAGRIDLYSIPTGAADAGVTARKLYRTTAGGSVFKLVATLNDNTTTTYKDFVADASLGATAPTMNTTGDRVLTTGAAAPSVNTAFVNVVHLSNIPRGPTGAVVARYLYRRSGGAGLRLLATINDNTTTTYTDTTANAGLGAAPPGTNTATGMNTVHLSSIPRGTGASANAVTVRKLYRRSGGAGLRYLATIPDNATSTYTDTTPNAGLGAAPPSTNSATLRQIPLSNLPIGNELVTARKLYRTIANSGGGTLKLVATIADNTTTDFLDTVNDAALGAAALTVGTAQAAQVQLSSIPIGAPAVIARVVYRTKAGLSQLQLLATLNDNTTSTWLDVAADATLGANAPIDDTSLLQQPAGNILAGSTSLPCASVAKFLAEGGWATAGSQQLRYTGISGTNLVGIPPSGPGSITATISYNTTIVAAPMLIAIPASGAGAIKYQILKGDRVNIFVQEDDLDAQAAVRAQIPGSDGIIEDELQDGRLSYTEGRARCRARLEMLGARDESGKVGIVTVNYVCRDLNSQAGATVTINIGPPINLRGSYLIQRVNATQYHVPNLNPTYTVEASSVRFSAEALLRAVRDSIT